MRRRRSRGSAVLYVVLLAPVLLLVLAMVVDIGGVQLQKERLRSALDEAVVTGSAAAAAGGVAARLDTAAAERSVRTAIFLNLEPLAGELNGVTPEDVAQSARVAVVTDVPASDPFDPSTQLTEPTVAVQIAAPVSTGLLAVAGMPSTQVLTLSASAQLRLAGT